MSKIESEKYFFNGTFGCVSLFWVSENQKRESKWKGSSTSRVFTRRVFISGRHNSGSYWWDVMLVSTTDIIPTLEKKKRKEKRKRRGKTSFSGLSGSGLDFLEGAGRGRGGAGGGLRRSLVSIFLRKKCAFIYHISKWSDFVPDWFHRSYLSNEAQDWLLVTRDTLWLETRKIQRKISTAYYLGQLWIPLRKILSSVCELVLCRYDVLFPSKLSDTETVISKHARIC